MENKRLNTLLKLLDGGYQHRSDKMFSFFVSRALQKFDLPEWRPVPEEVRHQIDEAVSAYFSAVRSCAPFEDILGRVYMDLSSHSKNQILGQFFTPWNIASLMVQLTTAEKPESAGG